MTDPAALLHEIRNALVPLDYALKRGVATLEDCAQVVRRLLDFADELAREARDNPPAAALATVSGYRVDARGLHLPDGTIECLYSAGDIAALRADDARK